VRGDDDKRGDDKRGDDKRGMIMTYSLKITRFHRDF
jgi:hypothetical protein